MKTQIQFATVFLMALLLSATTTNVRADEFSDEANDLGNTAEVVVDTPAANDCTGVITGAAHGYFKCVVFGGFGFKPGVGAISFTPASLPAGIQNVNASFQLAGEPQPGEYTDKNTVDYGVTITENTGALFIAQKSPKQGNAVLKITSASAVFPTPDGTMYTVHGRIEADLPQSKPDGSHGVAKMLVTF